MQDEANLEVGHALTTHLADHGWQEHEMIVVHPNGVTILEVLCNNLSEYLIGGCVCIPGVFVEGDLAWVIVEEWP
jgi:hypothetical protein